METSTLEKTQQTIICPVCKKNEGEDKVCIESRGGIVTVCTRCFLFEMNRLATQFFLCDGCGIHYPWENTWGIEHDTRCYCETCIEKQPTEDKMRASRYNRVERYADWIIGMGEDEV